MVIFLLSWEIWAMAKGAEGEQGTGAVEMAKLKPLWEKVAGDRWASGWSSDRSCFLCLALRFWNQT